MHGSASLRCPFNHYSIYDKQFAMKTSNATTSIHSFRPVQVLPPDEEPIEDRGQLPGTA